jgi:hypothetical protein
VLVVAALAAASLIAVLAVVLNGHSARYDPARARTMVIVPAWKIAAGNTFERDTPFKWAFSLDAHVPRGAALTVDFDTGRITVRRSRHIEEVGLGPGTLALVASGGRVGISGLIIGDYRDGAGLLLQRLAELHARLRPGQFPVGADLHNRLHTDSRYGTAGFWPGALWQASGLVAGLGSRMFAQWALAATLAHLGLERVASPDVGLDYGQSSLAAWEVMCHGRAARSRPRVALCARLRRSVLAAADELVALERLDARAGAIPTDARGAQADVTIDSMLDIAILPWASRVTGRDAYAAVARRHALVVARRLVRPDGSTVQVVRFDRGSGRVLGSGTRQGLSASSTWSRGQGWAVYGFAQAALQLHDRGLLRVALRVAGYVARRLPAGKIPRWDYDAPPGAPVDVSAGAITAAGLFHLVAACHALPGACGPVGRWVRLGRRMLSATLARAWARPPLGFLPDQVLNQRSTGCWCNGGELIFGLTYALEALRLSRAVR